MKPCFSTERGQMLDSAVNHWEGFSPRKLTLVRGITVSSLDDPVLSPLSQASASKTEDAWLHDQDPPQSHSVRRNWML